MNLLNKKDLFICLGSIKFASIKWSIMIFSLILFENSLILILILISLITWIDDRHYAHHKCHCLKVKNYETNPDYPHYKCHCLKVKNYERNPDVVGTLKFCKLRSRKHTFLSAWGPSYWQECKAYHTYTGISKRPWKESKPPSQAPITTIQAPKYPNPIMAWVPCHQILNFGWLVWAPR